MLHIMTIMLHFNRDRYYKKSHKQKAGVKFIFIPLVIQYMSSKWYISLVGGYHYSGLLCRYITHISGIRQVIFGIYISPAKKGLLILITWLKKRILF